MSQKIKLAQSRTQGEVVDDSVIFLKQNIFPLLKSYFSICGIFWVAGIIISILSKTQTFELQQQEESIYTVTYFVTLLFSYINFTLGMLTSLSYIKFYLDKGNQPPTVQEVWDYVKYYFLKVFGSAIVLTLFTALGAFMCFIPGIYLLPVNLLIITVMVMENESLSNAFRRGFQLIKNEWWNLMGVLLVTSIVTISCMALLVIPVVLVVVALLYLTNVNHSNTVSMAATVTYHALQFLFVFPAISLALFYFNLNEKLDDNGLMQRIAALGTKQESNDEPTTEDY
ncbi:hypothetical protein FO440_01085 [Mucilaginibacter corticis]|uniref:Glycerophosphoryl diester phosphodiesterase membrane domain-containing protein n=1 Tax=Mucilaginibacter corticis TaxID=2597670 RepID=A0A556MSJ8_9SPHI|nr:hypothetical protein [Mucilaginibacter corticis]TSJ42812.1 hypothetical protein FO440_01085 [Mucilaginibacter corticis]